MAAKPIWITAIGFHTAPKWHTPGPVPNEEVKADYLLQVLQLLRDANPTQAPIFWYVFTENSATVNGYSLVQKNQTVTPVTAAYLPAYTALKELWVTKFVRIVPASEDSFVSRNFPGANYAAATQLKIGAGSDIRQAYLKFDLTSLRDSTLQKAQLRFLTANVTGASSAVTQTIDLVSAANWSETTLNYGNQPLSPLGKMANLAQGIAYQIALDQAILQRTVGNRTTLLITSAGADELILQSRESTFLPKLIIYYGTGGAAAAVEAEIESPAVDALPAIEPDLQPVAEPLVAQPYDPVHDEADDGVLYERPDAETAPPVQESAPDLYLPFVEP